MGLLYLYLLYALKLLELNETEKSDRTADDLAVRSRRLPYIYLLQVLIYAQVYKSMSDHYAVCW